MFMKRCRIFLVYLEIIIFLCLYKEYMCIVLRQRQGKPLENPPSVCICSPTGLCSGELRRVSPTALKVFSSRDMQSRQLELASCVTANELSYHDDNSSNNNKNNNKTRSKLKGKKSRVYDVIVAHHKGEKQTDHHEAKARSNILQTGSRKAPTKLMLAIFARMEFFKTEKKKKQKKEEGEEEEEKKEEEKKK